MVLPLAALLGWTLVLASVELGGGNSTMKVIREGLWEEVALVEDPGNKDQLESLSGGM